MGGVVGQGGLVEGSADYKSALSGMVGGDALS